MVLPPSLIRASHFALTGFQQRPRYVGRLCVLFPAPADDDEDKVDGSEGRGGGGPVTDEEEVGMEEEEEDGRKTGPDVVKLPLAVRLPSVDVDAS